MMERAVKDLLVLITKEEIEMILSVLSTINNTTTFEYACNEFVSKINSKDLKNRFAMLKENEAAFQVLKKLHVKHVEEFSGKKRITIEEMKFI